LEKEIEFQELEIKLNEKKSKEAKFKIESKKELLDAALERRELRQGDLDSKKSELDEIIAETQAQEEKLEKDSAKALKGLEDRLAQAYSRLRNNAKNGLAVVPVDRDACGGCFNKIPPQRQLDIQSKKKVIVCEHCGRILVPSQEEEA
jgi:predicted  nucleic acid-binding Zn-ribbon protein